MTMTDLCEEINNWFSKDDYLIGKHTIECGKIVLSDRYSDFLLDGQYFRIIGSVFNDGVYKYGEEKLKDEVFNGQIWALAIPPAVDSLLDAVNKWIDKYADVVNSPFSSESFGGYSYTKFGAGRSDYDGNVSGGWQSVFASRLNKWRKI